MLPHAFLAFQQNSFLQELKSNLEADKYIVQCDFAENYSFILQDEIQGYHCNNGQATIHPFVIYFKKSRTQLTEHITFVIISDYLQHDTTSVHLFQRYLKKILCTTFAILPHHIYYFSDGAAVHYKNRKTLSISVITNKILEFLLSGIFLPLHMVRGLVMALLEQ